MAEWNRSKVTNIGLSLIAEAESRGVALRFTDMKTSSHDYSSSALESLELLEDIEQSISISEKRHNKNELILTNNITNELLDVGYSFKTYGLYANIDGVNDVLMFVATCENPDDVPSKNTLWQTIINTHITISNDVEVVININPSANATQQYVHDYINGTKLITIPTTGWTEETDASSKTYYTKTFSVNGILTTDTPTAMIHSSNAVNITTRKAIQKDYNNFFDYECGNGTYKILSYKIPTNQFTIALKGIGG